jgi:hypothetical protein
MSTYRRSAMAAVAALILAHVVLLVVGYGTPAASRWGDWIGSAASLVAALASWDAARRSASFGKRVWRLVCFSLVLATLGQIVYTYYFDYLDSVTSAGMWPSDVLVFFWAVPAMMTLFLSPRDPDSGFRWLRLCDFVQVCTLVLALELSLLYVPSRWLSSAQTMDFRVFHAALIFFGPPAQTLLSIGARRKSKRSTGREPRRSARRTPRIELDSVKQLVRAASVKWPVWSGHSCPPLLFLLLALS